VSFGVCNGRHRPSARTSARAVDAPSPARPSLVRVRTSADVAGADVIGPKNDATLRLMRVGRGLARRMLARGVERAALSSASFAAALSRAYASSSRPLAIDERDVREANETLEGVFRALSPASSARSTSATPSARSTSTLTHVDARTGAASMVNVGEKPTTSREAVASGRVYIGAEAFALVRENGIKKGDVLSTARLAGIMGAKRTHDLIPLCHSVALDAVVVDMELNEKEFSIDVRATASCSAKTGVEMEALTAVSVSGLTIYDMCKAVSKHIVIGDIRLESKRGGKSGSWTRM